MGRVWVEGVEGVDGGHTHRVANHTRTHAQQAAVPQLTSSVLPSMMRMAVQSVASQ